MATFDLVPVVNVHTGNFREAWPSMILAIKSCDFVALDTELSGLGVRKVLNSKSIEDRYKGIAETAKSRAILSLGISCFKNFTTSMNYGKAEDEASRRPQTYIVQTFNVTVLCEEEYVVEPASLQFLVDHGFDFNKQYAQGVPYYRGNDKDSDKSIQSVRHLFVELITANVPVVLHNGLVDMMFMYQNFYANLPSSQSFFLADLAEMFPAGVIDTKYITDFIHRMPASYLEYVFRKCQRDNSANQQSAVHLQFPQYPDRYSNVIYCDCSAKSYLNGQDGQRDELKKLVCETYAGHGWCANSRHCPKSHDVSLILDLDYLTQTSKSRKRQRRQQRKKANDSGDLGSDKSETSEDIAAMVDNPSDVGNGQGMEVDGEDCSEKEEESGEIDEKMKDLVTNTKEIAVGGHRAGLDAFMTGFIYAVHLTRAKNAEELEAYKNKIYLVAKDYPMTVGKSNFAKTSRNHTEKMSRIVKPGIAQ